MGRVRIKDIAVVAGVSVGTVDRVIHQRGKVSIENENLVKAAIEQLGYSPNLAARTLAKQKNFFLATITPSSKKDHFWQAQRKGIERGTQFVKEFGMTVENYEYDDRKRGALLALAQTLFKRKLDALLIAPTILDEGELFLDLCRKNKIPHLLINSFIESTNEYTLGYVGQNSYHSGRLGAKLLDMSSERGKRLVILHMEKTPKKGSHLIQKEQGFTDYCIQTCCERPDTIVEVFNNYSDLDQLREKLNKLLTSYGDIGGLFVSTSRIHRVVHALNVLNQSKLALVGFDLIEENIAALQNYPGLFLINQNPSLQGYYGIMHLFNKLVKKKTFPATKYLPLDIVTLENVSNNAHIEHRDNFRANHV